MARIRSIRPEFWKSESIACYDFFTRLVFIGLWSYVDDNGVGIDNFRLIAAELFPLEEDFAKVSRDLRESLDQLADGGRVRRYTVDGKRYIAVVNWDEHQKVDRPGKARYPRPEDPRASGTSTPTRENAPSGQTPRESVASVSTETRETPSTGEGEKGRRGEGEKNPPALAPLDAAEAEPAFEAEIVEEPANLPVVQEEPQNAGQVTKQWIDHCKGNGVKLTGNIVKRYGAGVKRALDEGFSVPLIKTALAQMLEDRVASRPNLLDNYLIRAQQGPELPPRRASRAEHSIARAQTPSPTAAYIHDVLTRPAS